MTTHSILDWRALKATPLDDDAFRLLAHPFGGPIPHPDAPKGADLDRQWFTERTDFKTGWFPFRLVDWHHRSDPASKADILGKAVDPEEDEDGQWVTVWLKHGERRVNLIKQIAERGQLFGSSEAVPGMSLMRAGKALVPWRRDTPGEIAVWPYMRQALSTSPQNTYSVIRPLKATLDDLAAQDSGPTAAFFDDLSSFLDTLATPLPMAAKSGRVLAAQNEARLREARDAIDSAYYDPLRRRAALDALEQALEELTKYIDS